MPFTIDIESYKYDIALCNANGMPMILTIRHPSAPSLCHSRSPVLVAASFLPFTYELATTYIDKAMTVRPLPVTPTIAYAASMASEAKTTAIPFYPMPYPTSEDAPRFSGKDLDGFIAHFEYLATHAALTDAEKCQTVLRYCSDGVRKTMRYDPAFEGSDWPEAKKELDYCYGEPEPYFSVTALYRYSDRQRKERRIRVLDDFLRYFRGFRWRVGDLVRRGRMTATERDLVFYRGLDAPFRAKIRPRLEMSTKSTLTKDGPPSLEEVVTVVRRHFSRDDIDYTSDSESESESGESDSEDLDVTGGDTENAAKRREGALDAQMKAIVEMMTAIVAGFQHLVERLPQLTTAPPAQQPPTWRRGQGARWQPGQGGVFNTEPHGLGKPGSGASGDAAVNSSTNPCTK